MLSRVRRQTQIVTRQPRHEVRRRTDVILERQVDGLQDVHESSGRGHSWRCPNVTPHRCSSSDAENLKQFGYAYAATAKVPEAQYADSSRWLACQPESHEVMGNCPPTQRFTPPGTAAFACCAAT